MFSARLGIIIKVGNAIYVGK